MSKKPLELKADIGHYGGYFVWVPKIEVKSFKSLFGKSFPRTPSLNRITDSSHDVFKFADRSKGLRRIEELEKKNILKLKFPDYGD